MIDHLLIHLPPNPLVQAQVANTDLYGESDEDPEATLEASPIYGNADVIGATVQQDSAPIYGNADVIASTTEVPNQVAGVSESEEQPLYGNASIIHEQSPNRWVISTMSPR